MRLGEISAANEKGDVRLPGGGWRGDPFRRPTSNRAPCVARFPRFVHGAGPQSTGGAVVEGWETQLHTRLNGAMFPSGDVPPVDRNRRRACRVERGDVPHGAEQADRRPSVSGAAPRHPAPGRSPRPRACRAAEFRPLRQPRAFSTLRPRRRSQTNRRRGGRRVGNATPAQKGAMFPHPDDRPPTNFTAHRRLSAGRSPFGYSREARVPASTMKLPVASAITSPLSARSTRPSKTTRRPLRRTCRPSSLTRVPTGSDPR